MGASAKAAVPLIENFHVSGTAIVKPEVEPSVAAPTVTERYPAGGGPVLGAPAAAATGESEVVLEADEPV